jgi:hypothetical protein
MTSTEAPRRRGRPTNPDVDAVQVSAPTRARRTIANDLRANVARIGLGFRTTGLPAKVLAEIGALMLDCGWNGDWHTDAVLDALAAGADTVPHLPPEAREWLEANDAAGYLDDALVMLGKHWGADLTAQKLRECRLKIIDRKRRGCDADRAAAELAVALRRKAATVGMTSDDFLRMVNQQFSR